MKKDRRAADQVAEKPIEANASGTSAVATSRKASKPVKADSSRRKPPALSRLRTWAPVIVLIGCTVAFVAGVPLGNLSSFGWESISALCPVGALTILLSEKALIPRALVSLVVVVALVVLFGRAFCSWICTVPLVQRLLGVRTLSRADRSRKGRKRSGKTGSPATAKTAGAAIEQAGALGAAPAEASATAAVPAPAEAPAAGSSSALSEEERRQIATDFKNACAQARRNHLLDSRHIVLGGALASALVFGFPVFCVLCPIGLSFAAIYLVIRLFTGQASLALLVVGVLLVAELLVMRRWCYRVCPVSAFMSLAAKGNRTLSPHVDASRCLRTAKGVSCTACERVCPEGIDLHQLDQGMMGAHECTKCRRCADACPTDAIKFPLFPPRDVAPGSRVYGLKSDTGERVPAGKKADSLVS